MSADFSLIGHSGDPLALRDEIASVFEAFEHTTNLQVCLKPMSDRWRDPAGRYVVPERFLGHHSLFCYAVKAQAFSACAKNDRADLPLVCFPMAGRVVEPFIRTCHAGADEVLIPLWSDGLLVGVVFVGQFTRTHGRAATPLELPHLSSSEAEHLRKLTVPLKAYLMDVLSRLEREYQGRALGRRGVIEGYIRRSLVAGPSLPELASLLSLSRSRTCHVVREETGHSFQDLVEERRITVARDLLANGDGTIGWIARQAGFKDTAYFCRYFKRKTGMTPTDFRNQYRRLVPV